MVSLKKKIGLFFINCVIFLCFMAMCGIGVCQTIRPPRPTVCTPGNTEDQYTASGCSYSTSTRTCCSDGTWSNWNEECKVCEEKKPCTSDADCCNGRSCVFSGGSRICGIQCSESSKPTCSLAGGTCTYSCTCNASTGKWEDCRKMQRCNVGYESVTTSNGICCQKSDGSGPRCPGAPVIGYTWVKAGTNCRSKSECGHGTCSGSCSTLGSECTTWVNNGKSAMEQGCSWNISGDRGICQAYTCR